MLPGLDKDRDRKEVWEGSGMIWSIFRFVFVVQERGDINILASRTEKDDSILGRQSTRQFEIWTEDLRGWSGRDYVGSER